jgi:hypothetical protein
VTMNKSRARRLHDECRWNREALAHSRQAGCFSCLEIYPANEVTDWCGEKTRDTGAIVGVTALCPRCGVDALLPSATVDLTPSVLARMKRRWLGKGRWA